MWSENCHNQLVFYNIAQIPYLYGIQFEICFSTFRGGMECLEERYKCFGVLSEKFGTITELPTTNVNQIKSIWNRLIRHHIQLDIL